MRRLYYQLCLSSSGPVVAAIATDLRACGEGMSCERSCGLNARQNRAAIIGAMAALACGCSTRVCNALVPADPRCSNRMQPMRAAGCGCWNG